MTDKDTSQPDDTANKIDPFAGILPFRHPVLSRVEVVAVLLMRLRLTCDGRETYDLSNAFVNVILTSEMETRAILDDALDCYLAKLKADSEPSST